MIGSRDIYHRAYGGFHLDAEQFAPALRDSELEFRFRMRGEVENYIRGEEETEGEEFLMVVSYQPDSPLSTVVTIAAFSDKRCAEEYEVFSRKTGLDLERLSDFPGHEKPGDRIKTYFRRFMEAPELFMEAWERGMNFDSE